MRCFERLFRRGGLPLAMSCGFHPKPRMTFPLALAVGIEGTDEVMELELCEPCTAEEVLSRLTPHVPPGLALGTVEVLPEGAGKARVRSVCYQVPVPPPFCDGLPEKIDRLRAGPSRLIQRADGRPPIDLVPLLEELTLRDGLLFIRLRIGEHRSARPRDVLSALGLGDLELQGVHFRRTAVELKS